jgi:hypothetical protein
VGLRALATDPGVSNEGGAGGDDAQAGGDAGGPGSGTVELTGTVLGFEGPCNSPDPCQSTLVLQNNGADNLAVPKSGSFAFPTSLAPGDAYAVTVLTQPQQNLGKYATQTCVVTNGTGTAGNQDVTNVVVQCNFDQYTVGGIVSGLLAGGQITLSGVEQTSVASGGYQKTWETAVITGDGTPSQPFTLNNPMLASGVYLLDVQQDQNPPQTCLFVGANARSTSGGASSTSGQVLNADISNLKLICSPLFSFETGTQGWASAGWQNGGVTSQSGDFHTQGVYSLKVDATADAGWFGVVYDSPIDLGGATHLKWDVDALDDTTQELAIQTGDSWTWCQGGQWPWLTAGTTTTMDVDLTNLDCGTPDLSQVHAVYVYFGNGGNGSSYIDNVRAE